MPGALNIIATSPDGAIATFTVSAYDIVDDVVSVSCDHSSGYLFLIGQTLVTCFTSDRRDNRASRSFSINIEEPACNIGVANWPAYIKLYRDIKEAKVSAAVHYKVYGFFEERDI